MNSKSFPEPVDITTATSKDLIAHAIEIAEYLKIVPTLNYVLQTNPNTKGYHTTSHMVCVASIAYSLLYKETKRLDISLARNSVVSLFVAGLFHDYDHSLGKLEDKDNISIAIKAFRYYIYSNDKHFNKECIERCIKVTEFPFVHKPTTLLQEIIRDADLLYGMLSPEIVHDLAIEMNFDLTTIIAERKTFLNRVTFFTPSGQEVFNAMLSNHIDKVETFYNT